MALSEFSELLAAFLKRPLGDLVSLTLTESMDNTALPLFVNEAARAAVAAGMRLIKVESRKDLLNGSIPLSPETIFSESEHADVVRFVYAPVRD